MASSVAFPMKGVARSRTFAARARAARDSMLAPSRVWGRSALTTTARERQHAKQRKPARPGLGLRRI